MERIDVAAAIVEDNGLFLACRRRPERGGQWEFPGGKIEAGESVGVAVVRELREELDIAVVSGDVFTTVEHGELRITFVSARLTDERPTQSTDHDQLEWLTLDELTSVDWAEADRVAVELLLEVRSRN